MSVSSPIEPFLARQNALIIDGGLATELEEMGFELNTALWSAHLLSTHPNAIRDVHHSYLAAGADCIIAASYQASIKGFVEGGWSVTDAKALLRRSVDLADEARTVFLEQPATRLRPLVAASIGPYGAYLANGAEYQGNYGISKEDLRAFHEPRWEILSDAVADHVVDLFACETIPSFSEAEVLLNLLRQTPGLYAWVSFSCRDGENISDGTPIRECAELLDDCDQVVAVGVNCTAPEHVASLIEQLCEITTKTEIVVYPNSGEVYDANLKTWSGTEDPVSCGIAAREWFDKGARLIGGCCRTGPLHVETMRVALLG